MVLRLCVFVIALLASLTLARTDEVGCGDDEIVRVNDGDHDDEETYDVPQRIIGGFKVDRKEAKEQFEWMGSIQTWFGGHYCGGTLITPEWVLTAATCVKGPFKPSRIVFGQYDLFGPKESNRVIAYVSHAVVHSKFEEIRGTSVVKHDIALLKLKSPVTSIAPMKLIPKSFSSYIEVHGQMLSALGWGTVTEEGLISPALKIAHIPVVSNRQCTRRGWYHPSFVDEKMMCAGYNAGGNSTCYGDNGGPLIFSNYKRRVQVGIEVGAKGVDEEEDQLYLPGLALTISGLQGIRLLRQSARPITQQDTQPNTQQNTQQVDQPVFLQIIQPRLQPMRRRLCLLTIGGL
eukprot:CAMPEP_0203758320 /NCGR_PEP_ID=MMETSP0098-20131031/11091_1 /ASSEMBLY_ACC=CAM_ASM_000208 /TAXON_ID=96639 /ORGANISM=" , Strain NY0313808BC1" /LENGTH=345 /DNA_ID=CAMNT_0050650669 /DNA_START=595 /DNA_END=1633 /DNA_ORIENTATION=-